MKTMTLPIIAGAGSLTALAGGAYYATYAVRSQWLGPTIWRGRTDTNEVALTFDDGPSEDTEELLDMLEQSQVKATFFMVGKNVKKCPRVPQSVVASGHEVGNHSY